jgi:hypothetical protein
MAQIRQDSQLSGPLDDPLIADALEHTATLWAALRLGLSAAQTDNVLLLKGSFASLRPDPREWSTPEDLGAGWQRSDRRHKTSRALPARIYTLADELILFVSEAELDPVERRLERGVQEEILETPERGLVSIAASMPALADAMRATAPRAAQLLDRGTRLTGYAEFEPSGALGIDLNFAFEQAEVAERTGLAASVLVASLLQTEGQLGDVAKGVRIDALGESVAVRLKLPASLLSRLLCSGSNEACS